MSSLCANLIFEVIFMQFLLYFLYKKKKVVYLGKDQNCSHLILPQANYIFGFLCRVHSFWNGFCCQCRSSYYNHSIQSRVYKHNLCKSKIINYQNVLIAQMTFVISYNDDCFLWYFTIKVISLFSFHSKYLFGSVFYFYSLLYIYFSTVYKRVTSVIYYFFLIMNHKWFLFSAI